MINSIKQKREFLGIKDITTERQKKNGTVIWRLPIKKHGSFIEVGSFESGYVRRMNGCWTPYQLNKCEPIDHFYKEYEHRGDGTSKWTGKYNKYVGKKRILIPRYWDRLAYLMAYCLKNYYINQANEVENGKFIPKWRYEFEMGKRPYSEKYKMDKLAELQAENKRLTQEMNDICEEHNSQNNGDFLKCKDTDQLTHFKYSGGQIENMENGDIFVHEQHAYWNKIPNSVQVIVDGHRYKIK
jgi:hypothetical protein